jgi:hypothetical protein
MQLGRKLPALFTSFCNLSEAVLGISWWKDSPVLGRSWHMGPLPTCLAELVCAETLTRTQSLPCTPNESWPPGFSWLFSKHSGWQGGTMAHTMNETWALVFLLCHCAPEFTAVFFPKQFKFILFLLLILFYFRLATHDCLHVRGSVWCFYVYIQHNINKWRLLTHRMWVCQLHLPQVNMLLYFP